MKRLLLSLMTLLAVLDLLLAGCTQSSTNKMKVVSSTTLINCIVRQVGGSNVEAIDLIPPDQHPGNFDIKPSDVQKVATTKLFFLHGYPGESWADNLVASANNPNLTVVKVNVNGNWLIPSIQSSAVDRITSFLVQADPQNAATYQNNAELYTANIQKKENEISDSLTKANAPQIKIIASIRQADFLQWAGFNVVATFGDPNSLTPQVIKDLVDKGKAGEVTIIVNNLQDGQDAGKAVAAELGAKNLNLSNFPGGYSNTGTWEKAIDYNVNLILSAAGK